MFWILIVVVTQTHTYVKIHRDLHKRISLTVCEFKKIQYNVKRSHMVIKKKKKKGQELGTFVSFTRAESFWVERVRTSDVHAEANLVF